MRLFLAVTLPEPVQAAIGRALEPVRAATTGVRWVDARLLHLTVKFLGERPEDDVSRIAQAVGDALAPTPAFDVALTRTGAFPNFPRARVVWLGMHPPAPLLSLAATVESALLPLGFGAESRPFRAHVTLGRVPHPLDAESARALASQLGSVTGPWKTRVDQVTLMQSTLGPAGPSYRALAHLKLGGR